MACNNITAGAAFVSSTLNHIDCQAQTIGSLGFLGLSAPGSPYDALLTTLLTIFIALFGFRLLFGYNTQPRDAVTAVLKIGIVLLLATSWPAYQTLVYNTVMHGPTETANIIAGAAKLPGADNSLASRLQAVDNAILDLTAIGSGRFQPLTNPTPAIDSVQFSQIAIGDNFALGFGRISFLVGAIGSLGLLSIVSGILLALAPIFAGLLLFDATRGLFSGWLKGLAMVALGSLGVSIGLGVQLAVLEPWLSDALVQRISGIPVPSAPSELLAINAAFFLINFAIIAIMARISFANFLIFMAKTGNGERPPVANPKTRQENANDLFAPNNNIPTPSHAQLVAQSIETSQRRLAAGNQLAGGSPGLNSPGNGGYAVHSGRSSGSLGNSYKRTINRTSRAAAQRDRS